MARTMILRIPSARRVAPVRLASVLVIPLAAALVLAGGVTLTGVSTPLSDSALGPLGIVLAFVKVCYLAVAMAHLGGAFAERLNGGLPAGEWFLDDDGERSPVAASAFWDVFPNHADGVALALAIALVCLAVG